MLLLRLIALIFVALAAADEEPYQAILYVEQGFGGWSRLIPSDGWCWNLSSAIKDKVRSVRIIEGGHCEFFHEEDCISLWEVFSTDQPSIAEGLYKSVKCKPS